MRLASQAGRRIVGARGAAGRRRPQVLGVGVGVPSGPPRVTKAREVHCAPFGHTAPPPPIRGGRDRFRLKEIAAQQVCWRRLPRLPAPLLPPPPTGILTRASRRGRQSRETLSIIVIKHHNQKQLEEQRIYFSLEFHITVHHQRKSGQGPGFKD
ncbi:uncharacterized protein LOC121824298 isoform X3 [Peromyscus maniculatus bairdii]|uniref:uncharacterized protein LOC121824298 isoform X3 n=1 Tax=Peromyscus maniculatus bairdii TaxID=230844 RepID=UPI003FD4BFC1